MNRRELLKRGVAAGGALSLAGCQGRNSCDPDVEKTDETSVYTEPSGQYVYLTTGTVTNVADCAIDSVRLEGFLFDEDDNVLRQNQTYVRDLSPDDAERFIMEFHPTAEEADQVDYYNVNASIQDE
jgi:hypothetical protein